MLYQFLADNRSNLIEYCKAQRLERNMPAIGLTGLESGVPIVLDQLMQALKFKQQESSLTTSGVTVSDPINNPAADQISRSGMDYGGELLKHGLTLAQVVHSYGDLCQAVTRLAFATDTPIGADEFGLLNYCLDEAIAGAVTEFSERRESQLSERSDADLNERLGFLAHELRNLIHTAVLAVSALKSGQVGFSGATGAVLDRCLVGLRNIVDRSIADVRTAAGMSTPHEPIVIADFIADVKATAQLEAQAKGCKFTVSEVSRTLVVDADREMLTSAVNNLLQNAFKFTQPETEVALLTYAAGNRVLISVKDHSGGLHPDIADHLFTPFKQGNDNKSGLGLGLSICKRSVEANKGTLNVRNMPGTGCVFTIDLPRYSRHTAADLD